MFLRVSILNLYVGTVKSEKVSVDVRRISRHKQDKEEVILVQVCGKCTGFKGVETPRRQESRHMNIVSLSAPMHRPPLPPLPPPKKYSW